MKLNESVTTTTSTTTFVDNYMMQQNYTQQKKTNQFKKMRFGVTAHELLEILIHTGTQTQRGTCKYKQIVGNASSDLKFKSE